MVNQKRFRIGVFDSGIGGITVLSELRRAFPWVEYTYLGDTAHVPYGTKSPTQIERLSLECAETLKSRGVDAMVVACNTASAWALSSIEKLLDPIPVFGVLTPGVDAALSALKTLEEKEGKVSPIRPILVLATRATVKSKAYGSALRKVLNPLGEAEDEGSPVIEQACPLLVPMIEEGWVNHPILHQTIQEYVEFYFKKYPPGVAVLACTHYPWIHAAFEKALPGWVVVNSAQAMVRCLSGAGLFQDGSSKGKGKGKGEAIDRQTPGHTEWIFTDPQAVPQFARQWIQENS